MQTQKESVQVMSTKPCFAKADAVDDRDRRCSTSGCRDNVRELKPKGVEDAFGCLLWRREKVVRREEWRIVGRISTLKAAAWAHSYSVGGTDGLERGRLDIGKEEARSDQVQFIWVICGGQVRKRVSILTRTMETRLFLQDWNNEVMVGAGLAKSAVLSLALSLFF